MLFFDLLQVFLFQTKVICCFLMVFWIDLGNIKLKTYQWSDLVMKNCSTRFTQIIIFGTIICNNLAWYRKVQKYWKKIQKMTSFKWIRDF